MRNTTISDAKIAFIRLSFPILKNRLAECVSAGPIDDESAFIDTLLGFLVEMVKAMLQDRDTTLKNEIVLGFLTSCLQTLTTISNFVNDKSQGDFIRCEIPFEFCRTTSGPDVLS